MENKKNTGLIVLVIVLFIIVLGLSGYIAYDKVLNKDDKKEIKKVKVTEKTNIDNSKENDENELITDYLIDNKFDTSIIDESKLNVTYYSPASADDGLYCTNEIKIYNIDLIEKNNYLTTFESQCDNKANNIKLYGIIKDDNGRILFHSLTDINGVDSEKYSYKEVFYLVFNENFETINNKGTITTYSTLFKDTSSESGLNGATGILKAYLKK